MTPLQGANPRSAAYHTLTSELLTEIERNAHLAARRILFCREFPVLLQRMGLACVRHTARLLPLLLEWLAAHDTDSRLAALGVLHAWLLASWPRVPAHAPLLQRHLAAARTAASSAGGCGVATKSMGDGRGVRQQSGNVAVKSCEAEGERAAVLLQQIDDVSGLLQYISSGEVCVGNAAAQAGQRMPTKLSA